MKKLRVFWQTVAMVMVLLLLASCATETAEEPSQSTGALLTVGSNGKTIAPYEHFVSGTFYTEGGWMAADGFSVEHSLGEIADQLETLVYADDFFCEAADGVKVGTVSVFDFETYDRIHFREAHDVLSTLPTGCYYVAIQASVYGRTVGDMQELSNYNCTFILEVPSK